ncbi:MAG TPA: CHRD domain-containing protein [Alphaproteobacteria bacterium]|nr:CHRD domain-containing protein [Alphaproteobacteria bacterium]
MSTLSKTALALLAATALAGCGMGMKDEKPAAAQPAAAQPAAAQGGSMMNHGGMMATLSPASEVPPVANSQAKGDAMVSYDPATMMVSWTVNYSGLSSDFAGAHIHGPAGPGANAGVMVPLASAGSAPNGKLEGSAKLTPEQAQALQSGQTYINIHTANNKAGELRGQIMAHKM